MIEKDLNLIYQLGFSVVILFSLMNLFYYGHVFAGGDAKLLFAMTAFFMGENPKENKQVMKNYKK